MLREKVSAEISELFKERKMLEHRHIRLPQGEVPVWILLDSEESEKDFMELPDVDGVLVGGASLTV